MPRPTVGALRHLVMLARRTRAPDADFGFNETMTLFQTTWAAVDALAPGVSLVGDTAEGGEAPPATHHFTIRRDPVIPLPDARTYVVHNNRRYRMLAVREMDQEGRFLTLVTTAQETGPGGEDVPGWVLQGPDGEVLVSYPELVAF